MRALQSSSQDCWPGFSDPGPGPADHQEDPEDCEDEDEKDDSNGEDDSNDMTMGMTLKIIGQHLPSPPWLVLKRCSLPLPGKGKIGFLTFRGCKILPPMMHSTCHVINCPRSA